MKFRNVIIYLIIFLPFIFNAIFSLGTYNYFLDNNTATRFLNFDFFLLSSNNLKKLIQISFFILPIITLTFAEIALFNPENKFAIKRKNKITSIGKISDSKGFPLADIWYFSFGFIFSRIIPFPIAILTLGAASLNAKVGAASTDFLNNLIPSVNTQLGCSFALLLAILVEDFSQYLNHRLEHGLPFLWQLHEFHHSASEMTILSNLTPNFKSSSCCFGSGNFRLFESLISKFLSIFNKNVFTNGRSAIQYKF